MSSSSSSSSASLLTSSIFRLNGTDLISGLDTDGIIQKLVSGTQSKIDRQKQLEQLAEWKQEAYRDIITQMQTFTNTYFSYTNSSSNLLSSTFFDITTIASSSSLVKASGSSSNAQNMVIQSISSLASKASYTSGQRVSDETIASGEIQTEWTRSNVGGKSLILNYDGKDYTVRLGGDLSLDSNDAGEDKVQKIVDELNKQIGATDGLKGNVSFQKTGDSITLSTADSSKRVTITDYKSDSKDTSGAKFLNALGFSVGASGSLIAGSAADTSVDGYLFNKTVGSDSEIRLNVMGRTYTLALGADYDISGGTSDSIAKNIATLLQKQIDADSNLKGKISVSGDDGKISFKTSDPDVQFSIEGGSRNLLDGLGLTAGGAPVSEVSGTGVYKDALTASYLPDMLSGNSLTFNLDGLSKTIAFDESARYTEEGKDLFADAAGIQEYLQSRLTGAFGTNGSGKSKVTVSEEDGRLTFRTTDPNSVLSLSSSDSTNVLSTSGALRIGTGESNRTELSKTLDELSRELNQPLSAGSDGKYTITVNGSEFKFSKTDTLSTVIARINDDKNANVTVSYSQTANTFRVVYDETGSHGATAIADAENGGNLAGALFGVDYAGVLNQASQPDTQTLSELYSAGVKGITANRNESGDIVSYSFTGTDVSFSGDKVLNSALAELDELRAENTAKGTDLHMKVTLNGGSAPLDIVRSSNTTTIDGVNLTVTGTTLNGDGTVNENADITFSAENNVDDLYKKVTDFINDYNKLVDTINNKIRETADKDYPPLTDAQKKDMSDTEISAWEDKAKEGILQNDSALNSILSDLRSAMTGVVGSTGTSLNSIGISTVAYDYTSGGQLTVDTDKLKNALAGDPEKIASMFTNEDGISQRVNNVLNKNVGTFGGDGVLLLVAGSDSRATDDSELGKQITDYKNRISDLSDELTTEESRYWDQFTAMEQSLSVLMSQSSYLTSMLSGTS